jgi:hypothetical protein
VSGLRLVLIVALGAASPRGSAAQDVAARMDGRVPADVARAVQAIAEGARARGLPVEPLIQKAIEGSAKGVPAERVVEAVRVLAGRLDEAQGALREAGIATPGADAVEGGAYALTAGLTASQVRELVRLSQPSYDPALTLHVAATLTALGVPPEQSLQVMERRIQARQGANELLDLPNEVEVGMARGATPAEATREVEETESQQGVTSTSAAPPPPNRPARANPHKP